MQSEASNCIFCKIVNKSDEKTEILFENEKFVVFRDIHPASTHHYLVVTKNHIKNPKCLTSTDIPFGTYQIIEPKNKLRIVFKVEEMRDTGLQVLESKAGDLSDALLGFHWPPFNSVNHLHLHVISPQSNMSFIHRIMFRPSFYFSTVDTCIQWLANRK